MNLYEITLIASIFLEGYYVRQLFCAVMAHPGRQVTFIYSISIDFAQFSA